MIVKFPKDYEITEGGFPVEYVSDGQPATDMYIFALEGEFGLSVWSCRHQHFIEKYTMVGDIHVQQDHKLIEELEQVLL